MKKYMIIVLSVVLFIACRSNEVPVEETETETSPRHELSVLDSQDIVAGETIYVPIYSSIFSSDRKRTTELTATMSIHNVDLENPIIITSVNYYNGKGVLVKKYLDDPIELTSLETRQFIIEQEDKAGGTGANFIVEWVSGCNVISPVIEAVMISTSSQLGISFTTSGKVVKKL
jgi:uncharacterized protein YcfL